MEIVCGCQAYIQLARCQAQIPDCSLCPIGTEAVLGLIYTQLWAGRRFVLVAVGFGGVVVFVFLNIGVKCVTCLATLVRMEIVCGCRAYIHPAVGGPYICFGGICICEYWGDRCYLSGNFGTNGNILWLLSLYTPSCGQAAYFFCDNWNYGGRCICICEYWGDNCYLSDNFGAKRNSLSLPCFYTSSCGQAVDLFCW